MIDNKEFLAIKASDLVIARKKLTSMLDNEIERFRSEKLSEKEKREYEEAGIFQSIADVLESVREEIDDELWIDQLGDMD